MSRTLSKAQRLVEIPKLLKLKPRTTQELAERFGVPVRTIQRDIETLRDDTGLPIESPSRGVYEMRADSSSLNPVEALAVHAAVRLLYHHSPTRNQYYRSALEKLAAFLPDPARTIAATSTQELLARSGDDRALELAAQAWFDRQVLRFEYGTADHPKKTDWRELEIYLLEVSRDNLALYAIGRERTFNKILTFKLSRMRQVRVLNSSYDIPEDFVPSQYLSAAWGVMGGQGEKVVTVKLRFAPEAAARVREGGYPNLTITQENEDGSLDVEVKAGTDNKGFPREILPWVQSWGPRVDVLEPAALRERWLSEASAVAAKHPQFMQALSTSLNDALTQETKSMTILSKQAASLWAKSEENGRGYSLLGHLLDVAAVAHVLLEREPPSTLEFFAHDLGVSITDARKWVAALVGLHDIGKATPTFQKQWTPGKLTVEAAGLFFVTKLKNVPHGQLSQKILQDKLRDHGLAQKLAKQVADAVSAHHGCRTYQGYLGKIDATDLGHEGWSEVRSEIIDVFLKALDVIRATPPSVSKLSGAGFIRLAGLTSFADWIGSTVDYFPTQRQIDDPQDHYQNSIIRARQALNKIGWERRKPLAEEPRDFVEVFPFTPNKLQARITELVARTEKPSLFVIEAPMGEGKTEAAFYAHVMLQQRLGHRGMYVALPTQATGNAMFERTKKLLETFECDAPPDLQLLHGASLLSDAYTAIQISDVGGVDNAEGEVWARSWFTSKKRALLSENGVGTVDQALLGILEIKHQFVRLWGLGNRTIIIDEVHAYEMYTSKLIERLVAWLHALGSTVIIMSATLPANKRRDLIEAFGGARESNEVDTVSYPRITQVTDGKTHASTFEVREQKPIHIGRASQDIEKLAGLLSSLVRDGGCAVAIVNTVQRAQHLYQALGGGDPVHAGKQLPDGTEVYLFHARFPAQERKKREEAVLSKFGKKGDRPEKAILIATQVVEQSLDLDFDVMVSDIAPVDLLLQRAGRMHRHERSNRPPTHEEPVLYVAGLTDATTLPDVSSEYHDRVYESYALYKTWLTLADKTTIALPGDFEPLIESVYGSDKLPDVDPKIREVLEQSLSEQVQELEKHKEKAEQVRIALPKKYATTDGIKETVLKEDDEDPRLHEHYRPATRLGEPSITVIPLYRHNGKIYLESSYKTEIDLSATPSWQTAKTLYMQHVKLTRKELLRVLPNEMVASWQKQPLLRYAFPLVIENGVRAIEKLTIRLDEELGVVYDRSE